MVWLLSHDSWSLDRSIEGAEKYSCCHIYRNVSALFSYQVSSCLMEVACSVPEFPVMLRLHGQKNYKYDACLILVAQRSPFLLYATITHRFEESWIAGCLLLVECDMRPSYLSSWNRGRRVCVVITVDDRIKSMLGCDLLPSEKSYLAGTACFLWFVNKNGYNKYTWMNHRTKVAMNE